MKTMFIGVIIVAVITFVGILVLVTINDVEQQAEKDEIQPKSLETTESGVGTNRETAVLHLINYKGIDDSGASVIKTIFELRKVLEPNLTWEEFRKNYDWAFSEDVHSDIQFIVMYYQNDEYWFEVNLNTKETIGKNSLGKSIIAFVNAERG